MRLTDMAKAGVAMQLLSNTPLTFLYDIDAEANVAAAAIQNDFIATHVKDYPTHFYGIGTLPLQAPERAAAELRRIMTTSRSFRRADRHQRQRPQPRRSGA